MRLLNTRTRELREFQSEIPSYAILSHTWQQEEVTFRDIADLKKAENMQGFAKILGACETALKDGCKYIWIDTCCINKESSAELSEAVNSMYTWYRNAHVCYAYLWDVPSEGRHKNPPSLFAVSLWFTRGWTLQELIAPRRVIFYGADWVDIGTKASLHKMISTITGIGINILAGGITLDTVPVAVRMSWAAGRNTTREEDVAYSLMGLFDVSMPLLYGEGGRAFIRLQHEIIKKSSDHSIFAWYDDSNAHLPRTPITRTNFYGGILARSPRVFRHSAKVERIPPAYLNGAKIDDPTSTVRSPTPYSITNQGLHIELPIVELKGKTLAFLNCRLSGNPDPIAIALKWSRELQRYIRLLDIEGLESTRGKDPAKLCSLYINAEDHWITRSLAWYPLHKGIKLEVKVPPNHEIPKILTTDFNLNLPQQSVFSSSSFQQHHTYLLVFNEPHKFESFAVIFGFQRSRFWCDILTSTDIKHMGRSDDEIFTAYRTESNARSEGAQPISDRGFADLQNGWSVATSLALPPDEHVLRVEVEITEPSGQQQPVALARLLDAGVTFLIIPPSPQHGFVVDTDNLASSTEFEWVQNPHSFILSSTQFAPSVLPFKNTITKERFYLVLGIGREYTLKWVHSSIEEQGISGDVIDGDNTWPGANSVEAYSAILKQGKSIFVMQRECRDKSVADFVITLSMWDV